MRTIRMSLIVLAVVAVSACSGNGGGESSGEDGDVTAGESVSTTSQSPGSTDNDVPGVDQTTATVQIGPEVFNLDGDVGCLTGDFISVTFTNATDRITITHTGDTTLIRMQVNATDWVDNGSPSAPQVVDVGGSEVVSWTGTMSSAGENETVIMEIGCP
ncbi:MAG: hypothetical protein ABFR95_00355 [Actinomycetota bacterium]